MHIMHCSANIFTYYVYLEIYISANQFDNFAQLICLRLLPYLVNKQPLRRRNSRRVRQTTGMLSEHELDSSVCNRFNAETLESRAYAHRAEVLGGNFAAAPDPANLLAAHRANAL
ncbi:unnamed protein product [Lasius platythorax]|uniref:Uncharacterized protein n=1 Tax=Lasius platythorax TaxID=488582 RepID=A0AAV2P538_9HYME